MAPRKRTRRSHDDEAGPSSRALPVASSSPPSSSALPIPRSWLLSPDAHHRYFHLFANFALAPGKTINLESFNYLFFRLEERFRAQSWHNFVQLEERFYPRLIRLFYANMLPTRTEIKTSVCTIPILLNVHVLSSILDIPAEGTEILSKNSWPQGTSGPAIISDLCGTEIIVEPKPFPVSLVNLEIRLIGWIVTHILIPRSGGFSEFTRLDALLMFYIKHMRQVNLPALILTHMIQQSSHPRRGALPYGMLLTRVFRHFGVDLSSESYETLSPAHRYDRDSIRSVLRYTWDPSRFLFFTRIRDRLVFYYSRDTPASLLPPGYSDGIPDHIPFVDLQYPPEAHEDSETEATPAPPTASVQTYVRRPRRVVTPTAASVDAAGPSSAAPPSPVPPSAPFSSAPPADFLGYFDRLTSQLASLDTRLGTRLDAIESHLGIQLDAIHSHQRAMDARLLSLQDSVTRLSADVHTYLFTEDSEATDDAAPPS